MARRKRINIEPKLEQIKQPENERPEINIVENKEAITNYFFDGYIWLFLIIIIIIFLFGGSNFKY
ncbi:hypothetical protein [Brassicibacter mesophilus]|jgi:hypothetical protein|uniref:hypothetical protein n=1 Tax=Brassicibacter mesophilus TaxID=745119 RepID=UPI003D20C856